MKTRQIEAFSKFDNYGAQTEAMLFVLEINELQKKLKW